MTRTPVLFGVCWICLGAAAPAAMVQVVNLHGGITLRTAARSNVDIHYKPRNRAPIASDLRVARSTNLLAIRCEPEDGAEMDIEVTVPYRAPVAAQTADGMISVDGFFPSVQIVTDSGDMRIATSWLATQFRMDSEDKPREFLTPGKMKFSTGFHGDKTQKQWRATDELADLKVTYGVVVVTARHPGKVELVSTPVPADSPIKLPWQAPDIVDELLNAHRKPAASPKSKAAPAAQAALSPSDELVFRSDVRVVNLQVSVYDREGRPLEGLKPEDFEVLEDGTPQTLQSAAAEELPFNLALLLDLSGSTSDERDAMKKAAVRFLDTARPQDRIAIYALANEQFHVLSPLTSDRAQLKALIQAIPPVGGGSPVYDSIVLAWSEELRKHPGERNALLVLSDGIDNQIYGLGLKSETSFGKLRDAAAWMDMLIYPIFLDPYTVESPPGYVKKAQQQLQELANATGGKLFPAKALEDLDPVYPQVAAELRSVYSVAYSPRNQEFNGAWRRIEVKVKRPDARVRTRSGYYAQ